MSAKPTVETLAQAAAAAQGSTPLAAPPGMTGSIFNLQRAVFEAVEDRGAVPPPQPEAELPGLPEPMTAHEVAPAPDVAPVQEMVEAVTLERESLRQFEVMRRDCPEPLLDSMRQLRSRLLRRSAELTGFQAAFRTVLVTSLVPGSGTSFVARNLAVMTGVIPDCRVLLAEANMARPVLTARLALEGLPGVRDSFSDLGWYEMTSRVPGLDVYVAGAGSAVEDEIDPCDARVIDRFRQRVGPHFDWLVLDGPALSEAADAEMLSHLADLTVIVMRPGTLSSRDIARQLGRLNPAKVAGVVFNRRR